MVALAYRLAMFAAGETSVPTLEAAMTRALAPLDGPPDYARVVGPELERREIAAAGDVAVLAGPLGRARLLDNHVLGTPLGPFKR